MTESGVALDALHPVRIALPRDSRDGQAPPTALRLKDWSREPAHDGWSAPLPFVARGLSLHRPPTGLLLRPFDASKPGDGEPSWRIARRSIRVAAPSASAPDAEVRCEDCQAREQRLNLEWSGLQDPRDFIRYDGTVGLRTQRGLLVPAPGEVAYDIDVPERADLVFTATVLPPEWGYADDADGVTFRVVAELAGGQPRELWRAHVGSGERQPATVPLDTLGGQRARLRLLAEPGPTSTWDYSFFGDPQIRPRRSSPRRAILIFIDTLRADRTTPYGGPPDATPSLQRLAESGVVFEHAYSVAPWTLPAWRSAITGRRPERWNDGPTLADRLRARGWATAMFAGNVYLSAPFDAARGWGLHEAALAPSADAQVDAALAWLRAQTAHDALLVVHLMDPHLPYAEPASHRGRFAGPAPEGWPETFSRREVLARDPDAEARRWIESRYLNNVRYADDAIGRLVAALGDEDIVVAFSDHGEEFWDEGGFEHGHTLAEAVVHVPLILRHPRAGTGRRAGPASLLDLVPTLLGLLDLDADGLDGRDLLGSPSAERPLPLGHVLYGYERWGAVSDHLTYRTVAGFEAVGPGTAGVPELRDLDAGRAATARAHDAELTLALRISATSLPDPSTRGLEIRLTYGAPTKAIVASEPALPTDRIVAEPAPTGATVTIPAGFRGLHEVFIVPPDGLDIRDVQIDVRAAGEPMPQQPVLEPRAPGDGRPWFTSAEPGAPRIAITPGLAVRPLAGAPISAAPDGDQREALERLGYALTAEP